MTGHLTKSNGDTYEGYWVKGKREGSGSYFYGTSGKVFVGEWGNDQPIAGIYQQAIKNPSEPGVMPVTTIIPAVKLQDPNGVIEESLNIVQKCRSDPFSSCVRAQTHSVCIFSGGSPIYGAMVGKSQ